MRYFTAGVAHRDMSGDDSEVRESKRETGSGEEVDQADKRPDFTRNGGDQWNRECKRALTHAVPPPPREMTGEIDLSEADRRGS